MEVGGIRFRVSLGKGGDGIMKTYRYQLTLRPFSFCTVPKGFIVGSAKDLQIRAGNYGSIAYPFPLGAEDIEHYDLKFLGEEVQS